MQIALLGHMGRDEALADRLQGHQLHILGQWPNPGLVEKAELSGGEFHPVTSIKNAEAVADLVQAISPDMFLTNFDDALRAGVVNAIQRRVAHKRMPRLLIPSPNSESAKVEWDKFYLRELINEIDPKYNPLNFMAEASDAVREAVDFFQINNTEIAIKPRNLTGGKGVKVQGKHFNTHAEGEAYALTVLASDDQTGVEIQEKLKGHEFTLQLITDGRTLIKAPATYDYPYREDGDRGPGTGGMGTFSMKDGLLPFVTQADYDQAFGLMEALLGKLEERGHDYKGVLYPTFFKTPDGLKIVEVNARGGDPELINILDLMEPDVDVGEVLTHIARSELTANEVRYQKLASALLYLVSPDYGYEKGPVYDFMMSRGAVLAKGCHIRYAAAVKIHNGHYATVGSSRTVGLSALGQTPWAARQKIHEAIAAGFEQPLVLQYRRQVAQEAYIAELAA